MQNIATKLTAVVALGQALQLEAALKSSNVVKVKLTGADMVEREYDVSTRTSFSDSPWNSYDYSKGFQIKIVDPSYQLEIFFVDDFNGNSYMFDSTTAMNWMPLSVISNNNLVPSIRWGSKPLIPYENVKTTLFSSSDCDFNQHFIELEQGITDFDGLGWPYQAKSLIVAPGIATTISDFNGENSETFLGSPITQYLCQEPAIWSGEAGTVDVALAPLQSGGPPPVMEVYKDVNCAGQAVVSPFEGANEDGEVIVGWGDLGPVWDNDAKAVKLTAGLAVSLYQNHLWGNQQDIGPSTDSEKCYPLTVGRVSSWKMTNPG